MNIIKLLLPIILIAFCNFIAKSQNIEVLLTDIRSDKGQIIVAVFKDNDSFRNEKPIIQKKFKKSNINKSKMIVKFSLDLGVYGLSIVDDENFNSEMDFNIIGMPTEGFGFSNFYHTGLSWPKFDSFKFEVTENQNKKIVVKIKYM